MKKTSILGGLVIVSSLALAPTLALADGDGPAGLAHGRGADGSVGGVASTVGAVLGNFHAADKSGNETVVDLHGKLGAQAISRGADDAHDES